MNIGKALHSLFSSQTRKIRMRKTDLVASRYGVGGFDLVVLFRVGNDFPEVRV